MIRVMRIAAAAASAGLLMVASAEPAPPVPGGFQGFELSWSAESADAATGLTTFENVSVAIPAFGLRLAASRVSLRPGISGTAQPAAAGIGAFASVLLGFGASDIAAEDIAAEAPDLVLRAKRLTLGSWQGGRAGRLLIEGIEAGDPAWGIASRLALDGFDIAPLLRLGASGETLPAAADPLLSAEALTISDAVLTSDTGRVRTIRSLEILPGPFAGVLPSALKARIGLVQTALPQSDAAEDFAAMGLGRIDETITLDWTYDAASGTAALAVAFNQARLIDAALEIAFAGFSPKALAAGEAFWASLGVAGARLALTDLGGVEKWLGAQSAAAGLEQDGFRMQIIAEMQALAGTDTRMTAAASAVRKFLESSGVLTVTLGPKAPLPLAVLNAMLADPLNAAEELGLVVTAAPR